MPSQPSSIERVACYARISTDLQRETSIDDQLAVCRRKAATQRWIVLEDHVYADIAESGASLDRPAIQRLLAAAEQRPRPFDALLVDDSSRVSRDLPDALRFMQQLRFLGVRVLYLSQDIDSASETADLLVGVRGMVDSLFLKDLKAKTTRGLKGQLSRGFSTGSRSFGYRSVRVSDPTGKLDPDGQPATVGWRREVVPEEAATIVKVFQWYADGYGIGRIVARLNAEAHRGPRGRAWRAGAVQRVLANERYCGLAIWGQRSFARRPGTRQLVARPQPRDQWSIQQQPELRIVSEELWEQVQARRQLVRTTALPPGHTLMRGRNAALYSPHLFSGFMRCGTCGGSVTTVTGGHKSPRYGCPQAWRNGVSVCTNRLTIRCKVCDARLVERLKAELLAPEVVQEITEAMTAALNRRHDERPRLLAELQEAIARAQQARGRLIAAIENDIAPATLAAALEEREAELARLTHAIAVLNEPAPERLAVMPGRVRRRLEDVVSLLERSTERTKAEFQRLSLRVTMTPVTTEGDRPFFRATLEGAFPELVGEAEMSGSRARSTTVRSGSGLPRLENLGNLAQFVRSADTDRSRPR